eukprot:CAMPEP_0170177918 /NCGR_PEP_ID=MMETSP0040_2-20121228/11386_1 /TAXON_ID=641309 /ORGANISM="Lotharella oceanica, Strain CCMP622" /LENGTH=256 /DNA_ID=CAMNT_0010420791 /DNA_START=48 /DNA_END=815 /DNA_ORIENTATION=+
MTEEVKRDEAKALCNKEKEDLKESLKEKTKADLKSVVLHSWPISGPSTMIRAIFFHYKVNYTLNYGPKSDSEYTKVPVVIINGQQINDSVIIIKHLAPILTGKPLTVDLLETMKTISYGLKIALDADSLDSCNDIFGCASVNGNCFGCVMRIVAPCLVCCLNPRESDTLDSTEYARILKDKLGEKPFFHGSTPGIVDIAMFALIKLHVESRTKAIERFFDSGHGWRDYFKNVEASANMKAFEVPHPTASNSHEVVW